MLDPGNNLGLATRYYEVSIALATLASLTVILRVVARWQSRVSFAADDILIIVAWVVLIGSVVTSALMYSIGGMGENSASLSDDQTATFFKTFYASQILYYLTMTPTKLSILFFYRRIFATKAFRRITTGAIVLVIAWCIACIFPTIFQCQPIGATWNPQINGTCIDLPQMFEAVTIANLLTDVIILCLPLPIFWNLKLSTWDRLVVSGVFLVGGLVCLFALLHVTAQATVAFTNPTVDLIHCSLWTVLEPELAIVAACLPTLQPLLPNPPYSSFINKLSFYSTSNSTSKDSTAKDPPAQSASKPWYELDDGSSGRMHGESIVVTVATAGGDEYPLQGYPLRGYREISEDMQKKSASYGRRSKADGRSGGPAWYERDEVLDDRQGLDGIHVKEEISIV